MLLSKFDVLEVEVWLEGLLKTYAEARNWQAVPDAAVVKKLTNTHRQKMASIYADKKVFRRCTDVNVHALKGLWILVSSDAKFANLPQTIEQIDAYFTTENLLKNGNTCTVALTEIGGKKIVIKRYKT